MTTAFTTASWRTRVERRWIFFAASGCHIIIAIADGEDYSRRPVPGTKLT